MKLGFIGAGNMASAIAGGIIKSKTVAPNDFYLYDKNESQYSKFDSACNKCVSSSDVVTFCDYIFFSVKPQNIKDVLKEISNVDVKNKVFVSICAGITISSIENALGDIKVIRTMPNTPLLIGQGVTALCRNKNVLDTEFEFVKSLFATSGYTTELKEDEINRITAVTSSSPAYVYLFVKSLLDGAKKMGLNSPDLLEMICKTITGSIGMVLSDSRSVDELIQMVKSPNGTTEKALNVFEDKNFVGIVAEAMQACADRADELAKMN